MGTLNHTKFFYLKYSTFQTGINPSILILFKGKCTKNHEKSFYPEQNAFFDLQNMTKFLSFLRLIRYLFFFYEEGVGNSISINDHNYNYKFRV